jgi:hypothetical protein
VSVPILLLLAAAAAGVWASARALARPFPPRTLAIFLALSVLPFWQAFAPKHTVLPLEHVTLTTPWLTYGTGPPRNPYLSDVVTQMLPWTKAVRLALYEGELPLRNRWNGAGTPLAANGQSAAFSPFTFATLLLAIPSAFLAAACIKLLLALCGMWLWLRELSVSSRAAAFGAIGFALSMTFAQWVFFPHTAVFCLWPWMLFLLERCRDANGRGRAVAALILVFAAAALAGHPETLALGVLFGALWIALRGALRDLPDAGVVARCGLAAGAAAAGLTAFVLLPTAFAIRASNRMVLAALPHWNAAFSFAPHGAFWRGIATAIFPRSLGDLIHTPQFGVTTGAFPEMALGYFGVVGWAAALLVLRPGSPRARGTWALLVLIVCGIGVSIALWPLAEIFGAIPVLKHVFPLRFYSWVAIAGPALAALELDRYARDRATKPKAALGAVAVPLLLAAAAALWFLHLKPELTAEGALGFQQRQLGITAGLLLAAAALALAARARTGLYVSGLAALCAADLLYQWRSHYAPFSFSLFYPPTPLVRFLQTQPSPFRAAGAVTALFPNTNVFAGVESIGSHDPVERRDYVTFLDATAGYAPGEYFKTLGNPGAPVLDFLNVRYLVAEKGKPDPGGRWRSVYSGVDGSVFENPAVLPRAFVPERVRLVAGTGAREPLTDANAAFGGAFREIAANPDWKATAWILSERAGEEPGGTAEISGYRETTNTASFDADVSAGGAWVVLSLVQDGGWSARDSAGAALAVTRANGPFLAVRLPEGHRGVRLRYRPPGFLAGAWISAGTLLMLAGIALSRRFAARTAARP